MDNARRLPITRTESAIGGVLLCLSMVELLFSDEQPHPTSLAGLLVAAVPPIALAFARCRPDGAVAAVVACLLLASVADTPSGTFGSGLSLMVLAYVVAAWSAHPWPSLVALVATTLVRDLNTPGGESADIVVDQVFLLMAAGVGRVAHRRTRLAASLGNRLEVAEAERDTRVAEAIARERATIAREMHDIVAHSVSLIVVQASTARPLALQRDRELAGVLATIETAGREALTELRHMLGLLRSDEPRGLRPVPGVAELGSLVEGFRDAGLDLHADLDLDTAVGLPPSIALCAYRTVQEGLTNALRYAAGARVDVTVIEHRGTLRIRVQDYGGECSDPGLGSGTGLVGLRERVLLCGGTILASPSGPGYLLQVELPATEDALIARTSGA